MTQWLEGLEARRLRAAGAIDPTFGTNGHTSLAVRGFGGQAERFAAPTQVAVDSAGRVVVASASENAFNVARLTADGRRDTRFAVDSGNLVRRRFDSSKLPPKMAIDRGNGVLVLEAGNLTRYTPSGKVDRTFGRLGTIKADAIAEHLVESGDVAVDAGGNIWVVGTAIEEDGLTDQDLTMIVARITPAGAIEVTRVAHHAGGSGHQLKVLANGSVIALGEQTTDGQIDGLAVKFRSDGGLDKTYGRRGIVTVIAERDGYQARAVGVRSDGSAVFYQGASGDNGIVSPRGVYHTPPRSGLFFGALKLASFVSSSDGRELVINTDGAYELMRYTKDGDADFAFNGAVAVDDVYAAAVAPDGSIVVAGTGDSNFDDRYHVSRLFANEGPAAQLITQRATTRAPALNFDVLYRDDTAVNAATLDGRDVTVTTPTGIAAAANFITAVRVGKYWRATYAYRPADDLLDADDNGVYTIRLRGDAVRDTAGNAADARTLGAISVKVK